MRFIPRAAAAALAFVMLVPCTASADIDSPGMPQYTNRMFSDFVTPTVRPGDSFVFGFNLTNPYDQQSAAMAGAALTVGIYRYATQEEVRDVDDSFERAPVFDNGVSEVTLELERMDPLDTVRVDLAVHTLEKTPHGSYFSQSTYFVRLKLVFSFDGNETPVVLQSRGFFTAEQWDEMVSFDPDQSIVDMTYMKSLGVDGLIPDSSFGIKLPIPRWPLALLVVACCGTAFMALYYFVLDNPGRHPSLEKRFYKLRGKLSQLRGELEHLRRK